MESWQVGVWVRGLRQEIGGEVELVAASLREAQALEVSGEPGERVRVACGAWSVGATVGEDGVALVALGYTTGLAGALRGAKVLAVERVGVRREWWLAHRVVAREEARPFVVTQREAGVSRLDVRGLEAGEMVWVGEQARPWVPLVACVVEEDEAGALSWSLPSAVASGAYGVRTMRGEKAVVECVGEQARASSGWERWWSGEQGGARVVWRVLERMGPGEAARAVGALKCWLGVWRRGKGREAEELERAMLPWCALGHFLASRGELEQGAALASVAVQWWEEGALWRLDLWGLCRLRALCETQRWPLRRQIALLAWLDARQCGQLAAISLVWRDQLVRASSMGIAQARELLRVAAELRGVEVASRERCRRLALERAQERGGDWGHIVAKAPRAPWKSGERALLERDVDEVWQAREAAISGWARHVLHERMGWDGVNPPNKALLDAMRAQSPELLNCWLNIWAWEERDELLARLATDARP